MSASAHAGGHQWGLSQSQATPESAPRTQWSAVLVGISGAFMAFAIVLVLLGVPARLGYDVDGAANQNHYTGHDPLRTMQSIDGNLKYVVEQTGSELGQLNGYFAAIDGSEDDIAPMAKTVADMTASIIAMEESLKRVSDTTMSMQGDMTAMGADSTASAAKMKALGSDISSLNGKMGGLYDATSQLVAALADIETNARGIADDRTSAAARTTRQLNQVLPPTVPAPRTDSPGGGQ